MKRVVFSLLILSFSCGMALAMGSAPPLDKTRGLIKEASPEIISEIKILGDQLTANGGRSYISFLDNWKVDYGNILFSDEIWVQTPYYKALSDYCFSKSQFEEPKDENIIQYFKKPIIMTIWARAYINSIDEGELIPGALKRNGTIIKPINSRLQKIANTSEKWPNDPAYVASNYYDFDISDFASNEVVEFILNKSYPLTFKIDFSKIL
jgi:hypothetical protein